MVVTESHLFVATSRADLLVYPAAWRAWEELEAEADAQDDAGLAAPVEQLHL